MLTGGDKCVFKHLNLCRKLLGVMSVKIFNNKVFDDYL